MARFAQAVTLGLLIPAALGAQAPQRPAPSAGSDSAAVRRDLVALYQRMLDGIRSKDTVALKAILSPTYIFTRGDGDGALTLAQRLRELMDPALSISELRLESCELRAYSGAAVAICFVDERAVVGGRPAHLDVVSTVTFVRDRAGRWRVAATHVNVAPSATP